LKTILFIGAGWFFYFSNDIFVATNARFFAADFFYNNPYLRKSACFFLRKSAGKIYGGKVDKLHTKDSRGSLGRWFFITCYYTAPRERIRAVAEGDSRGS
jgi:hypothetical protein